MAYDPAAPRYGIVDVPSDVPSNPLYDMFQRTLAQQEQSEYDRQLQAALAERQRFMAERGQSAPTYAAPEGTSQGSLSSIPHTGGYAGPTRASDAAFLPISAGTMRNPTEAGIRQQPGPGGRGTMGQVMDLLTGMKGAPAEATAGALEQNYPGMITNLLKEKYGLQNAERDRQRDERQLDQRLNNSGNYYNKKTGSTLAADFVDTVPTNDIIERDYVALKTDTQRDAVKGITDFDRQIGTLERLLKDIPMPDKASATGKITQTARMLWRQAIGEEKVREIEALQSGLLLAINRAQGGTSKTIDAEKEQERLKKAAPSIFDSRAAAEAVIGNLKTARDTAAKNIPIPGLHNRYSGGGTVLMQAPDGSTREVSRDKVDFYLQKGAKVVQ